MANERSTGRSYRVMSWRRNLDGPAADNIHPKNKTGPEFPRSRPDAPLAPLLRSTYRDAAEIEAPQFPGGPLERGMAALLLKRGKASGAAFELSALPGPRPLWEFGPGVPPGLRT